MAFKVSDQFDIMKASVCIDDNGFHHDPEKPIKIPIEEKVGLWKVHNYKAKCRVCKQWIVGDEKKEFIKR